MCLVLFRAFCVWCLGVVWGFGGVGALVCLLFWGGGLLYDVASIHRMVLNIL